VSRFKTRIQIALFALVLVGAVSAPAQAERARFVNRAAIRRVESRPAQQSFFQEIFLNLKQRLTRYAMAAN
jgi:hypothetical protein